MFAKISWLCLLITVGLLAWSGLSLVRSGNSQQDEGSLFIEDPEQDLGEQTPGEHTLELRVRNTSNLPRWILGMRGH